MILQFQNLCTIGIEDGRDKVQKNIHLLLLCLHSCTPLSPSFQSLYEDYNIVYQKCCKIEDEEQLQKISNQIQNVCEKLKTMPVAPAMNDIKFTLCSMMPTALRMCSEARWKIYQMA